MSKDHPLNRPGQNIPPPPSQKKEGIVDPCEPNQNPDVSCHGLKEPKKGQDNKPCDLVKEPDGPAFNT